MSFREERASHPSSGDCAGAPPCSSSLTGNLLEQGLGKVAQNPCRDDGQEEEEAPRDARRVGEHLLRRPLARSARAVRRCARCKASSPLTDEHCGCELTCSAHVHRRSHPLLARQSMRKQNRAAVERKHAAAARPLSPPNGAPGHHAAAGVAGRGRPGGGRARPLRAVPWLPGPPQGRQVRGAAHATAGRVFCWGQLCRSG